MTFRMRPASQHLPQARCMPPLAAFKKISGSAFPHVPADILSAGVPAAHHPAETRNGLKPKRRGAEKRTGI